MPLVFLFQKLLGLLQRSRKLLSDRLDQVGGKSSFIVLTFICWPSISIKSLYIAQLCPMQEKLPVLMTAAQRVLLLTVPNTFILIKYLRTKRFRI